MADNTCKKKRRIKRGSFMRKVRKGTVKGVTTRKRLKPYNGAVLATFA